MKIKAIDSHCHVQFPQFDADRESVLSRADEVGVGMICVGTDAETSQSAVQLARAHTNIWAAVGIHPNESYNIKGYESLRSEKVVAIGEIGLDYYHQPDQALRRVQEESFVRQLELAATWDVPVIIHCRDAHDRMLELLKAHQDTARGVIHSFNGTIDQALLYTSLGWYVGLNGIITYSTDYEAMVRSLPENRILLETDAPYLSPAPHRGHRNEPSRILDISERIAAIRGTNADQIQSSSLRNTLQCFSGISIGR